MRKRKSQIGDIRYKTKYAYLPTVLDGEWVWLEHYQIAEELKEVAHVDEWGNVHNSSQWQSLGEVL